MRIVCASLPGPGHAYPMLAVAQALARRGHRVTLASGSEHLHDASIAGCAFEELPSTPGSPQAALRPHEDAAAGATAFLPAMECLAPDVVVSDLLTLGPMLAAEALGVPFATLVIHGLHLPSRELPPFGWGGPAGRTPFGRARDAWMRRGQARDLTGARLDLNRARARIGLPPVDRLDGQVSPDLVLVATLPALEVERADWPSKAHVVGPCLWEKPGDVPHVPEGDGALVLVAASTAHAGPLLAGALRAVGRLGLRAVVTTGASALDGPPPARVTVTRFASHGPLLARADAVVCSGGHGIVARSLSAGVPLVVVPGHGDQRENAWRVERSGAGLALRKPTPRGIERALRAVLTDGRFSARARAIADEARSLDGPATAAALVEQLAAGKAKGGQAPAPLPNGGLG
jgi:MGT family glycosyltransferase